MILITVIVLSVPLNANASTNIYTGCIKTSNHAYYNVAIGTSPSSACSSGDRQVSADNGDIQFVSTSAGLTGGGTEGNITLSITDLGVTTAKIAANSITTAKLAVEAVTENIIAVAAVTTQKIAHLAVTTSKIASGAVTADKLDSNVAGGWIDAGETWTRTGLTTISVPSDATMKYGPADKVD